MTRGPGFAQARVKPAIPAAGHGYVGAYTGVQGYANHELAMQAREAVIGRTLDIFHSFYTFTATDFPGTYENGAVAKGRIPLVTWRWDTLTNMLGTSQDAVITAAAQRCAAFGKPMFLRMGWEMNGNWFNWSPFYTGMGKDPHDYVRVWRKVWKIFQDAGATNVAFVWAPNVETVPVNFDLAQNYRRFYPGDDYVDWIGFSGYQWGDSGNGGAVNWTWASQIFDSTISDVISGMGGRTSTVDPKPIMLCEWAVWPTPESRPHAITDAFGYFLSKSNIKAIVYFDTDDNVSAGAGNCLSDAASLAAFAEGCNQYYWNGNPSGIGKTYTTTALTDNPYGYWGLGENSGNFTDQGSGANTASIYSGAPVRSVPPKAPGLMRGGVSFKNNSTSLAGSVGGIVTLGTLATVSSTLTSTGLSIEFMIKVDAALTGRQYVFGSVNADFATAIEMQINRDASSNNPGYTTFEWKGGASSRDVKATFQGLIYDAKWHHVVWVIDTAGTDKVYVDGVDTSATITATGTAASVGAFSNPFLLGESYRGSGVSGSGFTGMIDEFAIYKSKLSQARVSAHYTALTT